MFKAVWEALKKFHSTMPASC